MFFLYDLVMLNVLQSCIWQGWTKDAATQRQDALQPGQLPARQRQTGRRCVPLPGGTQVGQAFVFL